MNFNQLLLFFFLTIFIIVSVVLIFTKNVLHEKIKWSYFNFNIYQAILVILLLLSGYYSLMGKRTTLWFAIFSLYLILSLFLGISEKTSQRNFTVTSVICLALIVTSIPIIQNRGFAFGPDQMRDLYITSYIDTNGAFEGAIGGGYYSLIPLFNVINAVVIKVAGWSPMNTFAVMQGVYSFIAILSIYHIVERLSGNQEASLTAVAIFLSTPRLTTIQTIPTVASISLGVLLVLFILEENMNLLYIVPFLSFTITVLHPIGVIPVLLVELGIILLGYVYPRLKLPVKTESYLWTMFTITLMVSLVYWSIDSVVLTGLLNPLRRLLNLFTGVQYNPSAYTPQYFESEFLYYSYAWALPVAVSAAYALNFIISERRKPSTGRDINKIFGFSSSIISITLLMVSFLSIVVNPGVSLERYLSIPAYTLMLFPSALIFHEILTKKNRNIIFICLVLLSVNIFLGSSSPNWAPFENPTFGAVILTYTGYTEAQDIVPIVPQNLRLYVDNDIPVLGLARLSGVDVIRDPSYQTMRVVVEAFKDNNVDWDNPRILNSITYIKTSNVRNSSIYNEKVDIVYSNGLHAGLSVSSR